MALSKSGLKTRITTEMESQGITTTGTYAFATKLAEAIANAIVDEITTNAKYSGADSNGDTHDAVSII